MYSSQGFPNNQDRIKKRHAAQQENEGDQKRSIRKLKTKSK